jgi:ABC-type antimicrobial peptide transport system permease subunit
MTGYKAMMWTLGILVWLALIVVSVSSADYTGATLVGTIGGALWALLPVSFATAGGMIIARQPRNPIGWILLVPAGLGFVDALVILPLASMDGAPPTSLWLMFQLWSDNFLWLFLLFPVFHLLLVFPTGQVISSRWRWLVRLEMAMITLLMAIGLFADRLGPFADDGSMRWTIDNPIGFIPQEFFDSPAFGIPWTAGLIVITVGGVAAMLFRYRRGSSLERQQIKLVMFAVALFAAVYVPLALAESIREGGVVDLVYALTFHLIPAAILASVLRYRLFDIDILIRRTILYAIVVGLLAAAYFGLIAALSTILPSEDPLLVAISTLAAAALFNPLRRRIQHILDRRFDRSRYDLALTLEAFVGSLSSATEADAVLESWQEVVTQAMHPRVTAIWVRDQ